MYGDPMFVVRVAGAGNYFENGFSASSHGTRAEADAAAAKRTGENVRVEDWTPTATQVEDYRASQE